MRIISGIQPTGILHIGNYFGAIKQWIELQNKHNCLFFIVDLHALTESPDPNELRKNILNAAIDSLALGLDPKKCSIFIQSQVPEHTELFWILNTITPLGELFRMTQFKDKANIKTESATTIGSSRLKYFIPSGKEINAGLLNYPVLMAADILLYKSEAVPVGEDQLQHLELARTLARKFNSQYGETFPEPKSLISKIGTRIMALDNPLKKMSKSGSPDNYIGVFEDEKEILRKIKISVTDSGKEIKYDKQNKPGISNLLEIYSLTSGKEILQIEKEFKNCGYAEFKKRLAKILIDYFKPFKEKRNKLSKDPKKILEILKTGRQKAQKIAAATMKEVRAKVGLK